MKSRKWFCESCHASYEGKWWRLYSSELKVWEWRHAEKRRMVARLEKLAANPEMRCPTCGGLSGLPKRLRMRCAACNMRYSPVSTMRFRAMREDLNGMSTKECKLGA